MTESKKGNSKLSKARYIELEAMFKREIDNEELLNRVLKNFLDIMQFDPAASTYTPDRREKCAEYRRKKAEEMGTSIYKALKKDIYYQKCKEKKNL